MIRRPRGAPWRSAVQGAKLGSAAAQSNGGWHRCQPPLSRRSMPKPVRARLSSLGGSGFGQNLAAQVASLSGRRVATSLPRTVPISGPFRNIAAPPGSPGLRGISLFPAPAGLASEYRYSADRPFAAPSPESSGTAGRPSGKWGRLGFRFASRFFRGSPFPRLPERSSLRTSAAPAVAAVRNFSSFPRSDPLTAKYHHDSVFRVGASGISRVTAAIDVDYGDKFSGGRLGLGKGRNRR